VRTCDRSVSQRVSCLGWVETQLRIVIYEPVFRDDNYSQLKGVFTGMCCVGDVVTNADLLLVTQRHLSCYRSSCQRWRDSTTARFS
jgi:hypothetical protein